MSVLVLISLAGCSAPDAPKGCQVVEVADLPLLPGPPVLLAKANFRGQDVAILISTGSLTSTVSSAAVDRFDLHFTGTHASLVGVGGSVRPSMVTVSGLRLGRSRAQTLNLPMLDPPIGSVDGLPVLGLFGADFLANYDLDIDVPHRHLGMYAQQNCPPDTDPFAQPFYTLPFHRTVENKIEIAVKLDGVPVTAWLDTGAAQTTISRAEAGRTGVTEAQLQQDRAEALRGIGPRLMQAHRHTFASLEVGDEVLHDVPLAVGGSSPDTDVVGNDFLRHNRVFVSYWRQMLFVQPQYDDGVVAAATPAPGPDAGGGRP